jgi:hypothetical protein
MPEEDDEEAGTRCTGPGASNAPSRGGGGGGGNALARGATLGENVGDVAIVPAQLERKLTLADVEGGAEAESLRCAHPSYPIRVAFSGTHMPGFSLQRASLHAFKAVFKLSAMESVGL